MFFGSIYFFLLLLALEITAGLLKADAENFHTANLQVSISPAQVPDLNPHNL